MAAVCPSATPSISNFTRWATRLLFIRPTKPTTSIPEPKPAPTRWSFHWLPAPTSCAGRAATGGAGQADFSVLPAGIGQLAFAPAAKYPVGLTDMAYQLTNSDTVAGSIPLLIEIVPAAGGAPIFSETRNYYLNAGESVSDTFSFDFAQTGTYIVSASAAPRSPAAWSLPVKVLNLDEVTTSVAVQPASDGSVPVLVNIVNSGYNDFAGTLVIEAGGLRHEEPAAGPVGSDPEPDLYF